MLLLLREEGAGMRYIFTVSGIMSSAGVRKDVLSLVGALYNRYFPLFFKILITEQH